MPPAVSPSRMSSSAAVMATHATWSSAGLSRSRRRQACSRWKGFPLWPPTCSPPGDWHPAAGSRLGSSGCHALPPALVAGSSRGSHAAPSSPHALAPQRRPRTAALSCAAELDADQRGSAVDATPCSAVRDPRTTGDWRATGAGRLKGRPAGGVATGSERKKSGRACASGLDARGGAVAQCASSLHPMYTQSSGSLSDPLSASCPAHRLVSCLRQPARDDRDQACWQERPQRGTMAGRDRSPALSAERSAAALGLLCAD